MTNQDFGIINARLDAIIEKQNHQIANTSKIFEKLEEQSVAIGKIETRIADIDELKETVKENTKQMSIIRGIGLAISVVYGSVLTLLGFRQ